VKSSFSLNLCLGVKKGPALQIKIGISNCKLYIFKCGQQLRKKESLKKNDKRKFGYEYENQRSSLV